MAEREPPRAVQRAPRSATRFRRAAERRSRPDPPNRPDRRPIAPRASQAVRQNQNRSPLPQASPGADSALFELTVSGYGGGTTISPPGGGGKKTAQAPAASLALMV